MRLMKLFLGLSLSILTVIGLAGCNNGDGGLLGGEDGDSGENANVAPEAREVAVWGSVNLATSSSLLQLTGEYFDADGDFPDTHIFRWIKDEVEIEGATKSSYSVTSDFTSSYSGCVTPIAKTGVREGQEECSPITETGIVPPPGAAVPTAIPEIIGTPIQNETIESTYVYDAQGGSDEGDSRFAWLVYVDPNLPTLIECAVGANCELPVENFYVDKKIQSCVIPQNQDGVFGAVNCTDVSGIGITMSGSLIYNEQISGVVMGVSGEVTWKVDTSNSLGFDGDTLPTMVPGTTTVSVNIGDTISHTIGVNRYAQDLGMADINGNGVIDDTDWIDPSNDGVRPTVDASHFIGKDIYLCIDTIDYGEICSNASKYDNPFNESGYCSDSSECVAGGLYQSNSRELENPSDPNAPLDIEDLSLTGNRGIEPVTSIELDGYQYHRPLFASDYLLRPENGVGENIPAYYRSHVTPGTFQVLSQFGEEVTSYNTKLTDFVAIDYCNELEDEGQWYLPVAGWVSDVQPADPESGYFITSNNYQGNAAVESYDASFSYLKENKLRSVHNAVSSSGGYYSPVFGWDLSVRGVTSSNDAIDNGRFISSYFNNTANQYVNQNMNSLVICGRAISPSS